MAQADVNEQMLEAWMDRYAAEDLDPELAARMVDSSVGRAIKHPLVYSVPHAETLNRYVNLQLRQKKATLAEADAAGDWHRVLWLHEKPYRAEALHALRDRIADDGEWWRLVAFVWTNAENHREWGPLIEALLGADRPGREAMMDDDERTALAAMPETLRVYRGYRGTQAGWSWTTERTIAERFALRFSFRGDSARVAHGKVDKRLVVAYFAGEDEVVVDPAAVRVYRTTIMPGYQP